MKLYSYKCFFLLFLLMASISVNAREKFNFNPDWKLHVGDVSEAKNVKFDDSSWDNVCLPYAFNEKEAFKVHISELTDTVAWYRKHFKIPVKYKRGHIFIEFEGARQAAEVWVNGNYAGISENGVMAFGFDITEYVKFGRKDNVIAVRTDNSWNYKEKKTGSKFQWNDHNFNANYGGLPKNVFLYTTGKLYQTLPLYSNLKTKGIYIYPSDIDLRGRSVTVNVESEVKNTYNKAKDVRMECYVRDDKDVLVKQSVSGSVEIKSGGTEVIKYSFTLYNVNFWSWGYGYLYNIRTNIVSGKSKIEDNEVTKTGFRKTEFGMGLFRLNGRVIQVKGFAQRSSNEWPGVGMSVPAWLSDFSNGLMVKGNSNLVRWMHITPWKQDVESCDRVGLMEAMPAGDSEGDIEGRRWEQRKEVMRDAIIYNRNNPSIIFYECGNENISEEHMREMKEIRDEYDPHGGRAIGSREMLNSKIAEYGGEMLYINKSAKKPVWAMEYCRDEALRLYWDDKSYPYHKEGEGPLYRGKDASAYNHNQDMYAMECVRRWYDYWEARPGTGRRVSSGGVKIIFSDTNTHCRGKENYRRSGSVDAIRIPKDAYYAHKVMWDGWVDVENKSTHIIGHWNYKEGTVKNVYVVSSSDKVELFLNGKSLGYGERSSHFWFTFKDVHYVEGNLIAVGYDKDGNKESRDVVRTAGKPSGIVLSKYISPDGFHADGSDMALIQVEVVDAEGHRCPLANNMINFEVKGPVEYTGGIAKGKDNYVGNKDIPVECGVNRILVRSLRKAGTAYVIATSDGLGSDTVKLNAIPVEVKHGLSSYIQGEDIPSYLDRGPVPDGASYKVTRIPVYVKDVEAGARQDKAVFSYDDDETTEWLNDGKLSTAWIKYNLVRKAKLSEICLKLTGWRKKSYRLKVSDENNNVLWEGRTPKSLGYVTLKLDTVVLAGAVKIELAGNVSEDDAFSSIVEVKKGKDIDGVKKDKSKKDKGRLRIIEVEFYEKR